MKKIKAILIAILVVTTIVCSTSCGINAGNESSSQSSSDIQEDNKFGKLDYDEVCKSVTINGIQCGFPFCVKDLGDDYTLEKIEYCKIEKDDKYYSVIARLDYNNVRIATVDFYGITEEEKNNESIDFYSREIDLIENDSIVESKCISVIGISIGDNADLVLNLFGEPEEKHGSTDDNGSYIYFASTTKTKEITFYYRNKKIDGIMTSVNINR